MKRNAEDYVGFFNQIIDPELSERLRGETLITIRKAVNTGIERFGNYRLRLIKLNSECPTLDYLMMAMFPRKMFPILVLDDDTQLSLYIDTGSSSTYPGTTNQMSHEVTAAKILGLLGGGPDRSEEIINCLMPTNRAGINVEAVKMLRSDFGGKVSEINSGWGVMKQRLVKRSEFV